LQWFLAPSLIVTMSALLSGYGSSDDESPVASSSKIAKVQAPTPQNHLDEEDDDETLEQAARADAFGLTGAQVQIEQDVPRADERRKEEVLAAPDVLKYVSYHLSSNYGGN
jgi:pre-mRNA-processing factor 17